MSDKRYVVVTDTTGEMPHSNFEKVDTFDMWVESLFKQMRICETGSGYGFGGRDITGIAPTEEMALCAKEYFNLFHKVKCELFDLVDEL